MHEIGCAFVAGCDGDHGVSRVSAPSGTLAAYAVDHGFAWLTVFADAPPPRHPLYAVSSRGFAAHFGRGPRASRFYLQCLPSDQAGDWPDDRIWQQLRTRLGHDDLPGGPVTEKEIFPLRSLVHEPMSYGRLYLLGDAAHVIAPLGGKGMNLALYDAEVFALAVRDFTRGGDDAGLRSYSDVCLRRTWNYQEFSQWMTEAAHDACDVTQRDPFRARLARARLDRLFTSPESARAFAELTAGLA
jgi:p-hydroxybenzoate 3-monooxygenase